MMNTVEIIRKNNDRMKGVKKIIRKFKKGELSPEEAQLALINDIRFLFQIGATSLFHKVLEMFDEKYEDNIEIQICRMLDCYGNYDYTGMAYQLQIIRNLPDLSLEQRAVVAINTIFANANGGCFDDYVESAIDELEQLICEEKYFTFEGLENLMQELEGCEQNRLDRYIRFIENYECRSWKEYDWITSVLFNHYRRVNDFLSLRNLLKRFSEGILKFNLSNEERLQGDIQFMRLLFECRDGNWENFSIELFRNHATYLNADIEVAFAFTRQFFSIMNDGAAVYGRHLNEKCVVEISQAINHSLKLFLDEYKELINAPEPELLNTRRFIIEIRREILNTDSLLQNYDIATYRCEMKRIHDKLLNLCRINGNKMEFLHWLLCNTDDLFALSEETDIKDDLRVCAEQLETLLKDAGYTPSVAYYLIFLSDFYDYLGEESNARETLRKFNDSGANIKVYNISIQRKYLKLEDKYRLLPSDERRILIDTTSLLSNLNTTREIEEALIRAEESFGSIDFSDNNYVATVGLGTLMLFLTRCSQIFLNANRFELLDLLWNKVMTLGETWNISSELKAEILIAHAVGLFRRGNHDAAYTLLEPLQGEGINDILKLQALMVMGDIEASKSWPDLHIDSLSKALGLAEQIGHPVCIAQIYHKLGNLFGPYYPAMGLSFLRKSETLYGYLGMTDDQYEMALLRAQASMMIHKVNPARYSKGQSGTDNTLPFLEEAARILKDYPRSVFRSESTRAFHDRLTGIMTCDSTKFEDAFLFYSRVNAYDEILRVLESAVITFSINGNNGKALEFAERYLKVVTDKGDNPRIFHCRGMIETLRHPLGYVVFPISRNRYKETSLFDIIDRISFDEEKWALDKSPIRCYFPYPCDEGKCVPFDNGESVSLSPVCLLPFTYYRGQSVRYPECFPSLFRSGMSDSRRFLERLRYCEFHILLDTHPMCTKFRDTFKYKFPDGIEKTLNFHIYHLALAQHYGIATELMDVTSDKWVAAFFAATKYENDTYSPFTDEGKGVFYTCMEENPDNPVIHPIGIQPFSRPGEQRGYAVPMKEKENFENILFVEEFRHYPEINEFIFNFSNRSRKLFPDDILKSKGDIIKKSRSFSRAAFDMAILKFYQDIPKDIIDEWLKLEGISIVDQPVIRFTTKDMEDYRQKMPQLLKAIQDNILVLNLRYSEGNGLRSIYPVR